MKAIVALLAVFVAVSANKPGGPVGSCPEFDGEFPVYLPDLTDRGVFYECSNGFPFLQKCARGLVFVTNMNVCGYPSDTVKPCGPVGMCPKNGGDAYLRDGCNVAVYYECRDGNPTQSKCPVGQYFNMYAGKCDVITGRV